MNHAPIKELITFEDFEKLDDSFYATRAASHPINAFFLVLPQRY